MNTPGSYLCTCLPGYASDPVKESCVGEHVTLHIIQAGRLASLAPLLHPIGDEACNYLHMHMYTCTLE